MRIDAHQHFWHYDPHKYEWIDESMSSLRRDFLPQHLGPELERTRFDATIAVQARQTLQETHWLLELAENEPTIVGVVGWVDLRSPELKSQLAEFAGNRKLLGVRHIVQSESDDRFLLQPDFLRGIAALEEFDLTYDILIYTHHLPVAAALVARFPSQRFVLDHLAKPPIKSRQIRLWESGIRALANFRNVMCKVSGLVTEADWQAWKPEHITPYLDIAMDAFGPDRLMIGSDWPVCLVAGSYAQVMELFENYLSRFSDPTRNAVLGGNAERFWNLKARNADPFMRNS